MNHSSYIVIKRFRQRALGGDVNLPYGTSCEAKEGCIYHDDKPLCYVNSHNAHRHFALNDDGCGLRRGELTQAIQRALAENAGSEERQAKWDKVWEDSVCRKYKRKDHADYWLWDSCFFNAPIADLEHIAGLVGVMEARRRGRTGDNVSDN